MAWQITNISWGSGYNYITVAGWQNIAELIGGEVKSAQDWGMTSVSGLYDDSPQPTIDNLAVYVPDGANYGVIAFGGGGTGTYYQNNRLYFVPMETGEVAVVGECAFGINRQATTVRVWAGDGFSIVTSLANAQYSHGGFAIDTFEDSVNGRTVLGILGSSSLQSGFVYDGFDLEYGGSATVSPSGTTIGTMIQQSDGRLYFEVIKAPLIELSGGLVSKVLVAEHIYGAFIDYNYLEKNVLVNGVVFGELLNRGIYFPTE